MSNLRAVLSQPSFTALSDADALSALETPVIKTDNTPYTWSGLSTRLIMNGMSSNMIIGLDAWVTSINNYGGAMLRNWLNSGGIDFTLDSVRENLSTLRPNLDDTGKAYIDALLTVGQWVIPYWQDQGILTSDFGNGLTPQLSDVQTVRATIASDALRAKCSDAYNSLVVAMNAGTVTTWQQVQALIAGIR
jgi:hypothetical protein